jgi:hypothetical protein
LIHKWHEFIRESRHRAADANTPDVGAAADSSDPASLSNIALNHRPPAPQFNDALARAVLFRELGLLIISAAIATLVNGLAKKPNGPQGFIERNHGCTTSGLVQEIKQSLHEIVRLDRAARDTHDGNARMRFPLPAQVISQAHGAGGISLHRMDAAVGGACPGRHHRPGVGRETVNPLTGGDWLAGCFVGS